jgi:hypothetical protein
LADIVSEQPAPLARPQPEPSVSRRRFAVAYLALAAIVGAAIGLVVVFARDDGGGTSTRGASWSAWKPADTGTLGVREIARHVAPSYRLKNGNLLTSVVAGPMVVPSTQGAIPVTAILVRSGSAGVREQRIDVAFPEAGVFYQLCGLGSSCAIPGTSTVARGQLVRRQAVELGLYTFHYLPQADYVLAFIPPPSGVAQSNPNYQRALFMPRAEFAAELAKPLNATIKPVDRAVVPGSLPRGQGTLVDGLTAGRIFHYDFQQGVAQSALIVLSPIES